MREHYIDDVYFDNYLYTGVPELTPLTPQSRIPSGYQFRDALSISYFNDSYADMYYTTDGSEPSVNSIKYTDAIDITETTTIKIVSYKHGLYSEVITNTYTKNPAVPTDVMTNREAGRYTGEIEVILSNVDNLDIYYTVDGSEPNTNSILYTEPVLINTTTEVKAVSYDGNTKGNIRSFMYTFPTTPTAVSSTIKETALTSSVTMELISDLDADIYYTIDGSEPTIQSTRYVRPITLNQSTTIKAIAVRDGLQSKVTTMQYIIAPIDVVADKPAGTYEGSTIVEFRVPDTDQVEIYYTTDGSEPTIDSTHYTGPIRVSENTTFKVGATYIGSSDMGSISTHAYVINPMERLVAPTITPSSGAYGQRQLVSISTETINSTIHYTIDGTTPTKESPIFTGDFYVTKDTLVKAIAVKNNQVSEVIESSIVITTERTPFLKTDGKDMRNNYGAGQIVHLKGTNIGGWLVMEEWQSPTNAPDQLTMLTTLTERFGEDKAWELINTFQDHWFVEEDFKILKEEGVNVIRLPITYFEMANVDGSLKETAFDRLDWFIEEAAKYEIYTLIDMHGAFGSQNGKDHSGDISIPDKGNLFGNEENIQKTIALWEEIAKRYNGNPWIAGYDLLNEPGGALGTEQFEVYDRLYQAIRAIDQDHIIHIQAIWEPMHLPNPELYGWENVVYQYHFYGWSDLNNLSYQKAFIDSKVSFVNEQTNYNVPLFVGEFTFFENIDSWDYGLGVFHEEGWSYTSWTYKVAGSNSSWGMYTMPKNDTTNVDIYNDDFETIKSKWSNFNFTRNTPIADILSTYFKSEMVATGSPVITGRNATVTIGTGLEVIDIIDLFIKDHHDGVIHPNESIIQALSTLPTATYTTDFNKDVEGEYYVNVTALNSAGNQSNASFTITVIDEDNDDANNSGGGAGNSGGDGIIDLDNSGNSINNGSANNGNNNNNGSASTIGIPAQTGDTTAIHVLAFIMVLSISIIVVIMRKKQREE